MALFDAKGNVPDTIERLAGSQRSFRDFALPPLADTPPGLRLPAPALLGKADGAGAALDQLTASLGLPKRGWRRVETPEGLDDVIIHGDYLPHIVEKRADARERFAHYLLPTLQDPLEVWLTRYDDGSYRRRFIALFEESKRQSLVIARENRDGSLMFNFVPPADGGPTWTINGRGSCSTGRRTTMYASKRQEPALPECADCHGTGRVRAPPKIHTPSALPILPAKPIMRKSDMDNQHRRIKGYRELSEAEIALMNDIKELGEALEQLVERLRATEDIDQRGVSIGATGLQTALMALTRAVARPESF